MPNSRWTRRISSRSDSRTLASSADSGSSSSSSRGCVASARASATRCFWPPESWCGYSRRARSDPSPRAGRRRSSSAPPARSCASGGRTRCWPAAVMFGNSEYSWNTIPKPRFSVGVRVMSEPPTCTSPASGRSKPGQDPQRGRLAAAGRAEQADELAGLDLEVERLERHRRAERLAHAAHRHCRHEPTPPSVVSRPRRRIRRTTIQSRIAVRTITASASAIPARASPRW